MIFEPKKASALYLALFIALIADATLFVWAFAGHRATTLTAPELYFLSIGQGDSSLIQLPGGEQILIDGGPSGKALIQNLEKILPPQDRYIDLLVSTHPQLDHFGGFIDLLKRYQVGLFLGNGRTAKIAAYPELISQLKENDVRYLQVQEGDNIRIGDTKLKVLGPSKQNVLSGELNDTGIVLLLDSPQIRALYTADIGFNVENELIKKYDLDVDVLKVGHHGSRFSSGETFLAATSPLVATIGVGKNTYGHPTQDALGRLTKYVRQVTRADQDGIVKVVPDDETIRVYNLQ